MKKIVLYTKSNPDNMNLKGFIDNKVYSEAYTIHDRLINIVTYVLEHILSLGKVDIYTENELGYLCQSNNTNKFILGTTCTSFLADFRLFIDVEVIEYLINFTISKYEIHDYNEVDMHISNWLCVQICKLINDRNLNGINTFIAYDTLIGNYYRFTTSNSLVIIQTFENYCKNNIVKNLQFVHLQDDKKEPEKRSRIFTDEYTLCVLKHNDPFEKIAILDSGSYALGLPEFLSLYQIVETFDKNFTIEDIYNFYHKEFERTFICAMQEYGLKNITMITDSDMQYLSKRYNIGEYIFGIGTRKDGIVFRYLIDVAVYLNLVCHLKCNIPDNLDLDKVSKCISSWLIKVMHNPVGVCGIKFDDCIVTDPVFDNICKLDMFNIDEIVQSFNMFLHCNIHNILGI